MRDACGRNKVMVITILNLTDITSPGFPDRYPDNMDCKWLIVAEDDKQIEISLRGHEVESE